MNEDKEDKSTAWFSDRAPTLYNTVFAGIQTPYGLQIKFKYYLDNFVDTGYTADDGNGNTIYPYKDLDANIFYVSLSFQILRDAHLYYAE